MSLSGIQTAHPVCGPNYAELVRRGRTDST